MSKYSCFSVCMALLISCTTKEYKEPKNNISNEWSFATAKTIAQLRASMNSSASKLIGDNIVISGFVIANDKSGNLYKQIIIDDGTAAIPLLLDAFNLYNDFPIGCKVYVKCKGLYTNYFYKLPHISFMVDDKGVSAAIPFHLWEQFIFKSDSFKLQKPIVVSLQDAMKAKPELYNRLVTIEDVQLQDTSTKVYALHPDLTAATSFNLTDCAQNIIAVRTSGYASFRNSNPPVGRGNFTAIYTVFNNTPQLVLRDTTDVQLAGTRCF